MDTLGNAWVYTLEPLGAVTIVEAEGAVTGIYFGRCVFEEMTGIKTPLLDAVAQQLREYLNGKRQIFDLPLSPRGTAFQKKVWEALLKIPYGQTRSYKEIAQAVDSPKAYRAVGMANNKNPISIVIPCHRVIGSSGKLVGYGGGLEIKEMLLALEGCAWNS